MLDSVIGCADVHRTWLEAQIGFGFAATGGQRKLALSAFLVCFRLTLLPVNLCLVYPSTS